jgi:branched-chain amino acid transport system permease protein
MSESGAVAAPSTTSSSVAIHWASRHKHWLMAAVALLVLPFVPGLNSDYGRSLLSQMGIAAVFALSFNVLLGQTGLLSFGHAVYFGLGG